MNRIDGPEAEQRLAAAMGSVDGLVTLTRTIYAQTAGMSQARRLLSMTKMLRNIHAERLVTTPDLVETMWLPALAALLLKAADPDAETLKALEEH